jgi:hypothetical protein
MKSFLLIICIISCFAIEARATELPATVRYFDLNDDKGTFNEALDKAFEKAGYKTICDGR